MSHLGSITKLPPEILEHIVERLPTASDLSHFSQTSRVIRDTVEKDGWRAFATRRFPSIVTPPVWKNSAHALTTLSRNLDRRAFVAREYDPSGPIRCLPDGTLQDHWQHPRGQTMGYQAVLDSYEAWTTGDWASRQSIVAWGAGAELVIHKSRSPPSNPKSRRHSLNASDDDHWLTFREKHQIEGRDDITSVNIVHPRRPSDHHELADSDSIVVGRANGELNMVQIAPDTKRSKLTHFNTAGTPVRAADVSATRTPLIASCLSDDRVVIYPLRSSTETVQPLGQAMCTQSNARSCRAWSINFISEDKLAVGLGPSNHIVKIFDVSNEGLSSEPVRSFGNGRGTPTSAYPVRALPSSASDGGSVDGQLILSGGYDGTIRLHDLRSPADFENVIDDPIDNSAVFSLETIGRERIIAGSSTHSLLKVYDLRMAGGRAYDYLNVASQQHHAQARPRNDNVDYDAIHTSGFNVFIGQNRQIASSRRRQAKESPIYSLSRPSQSSPLLYAGLENSVVEFNFTSVTDPFPDPAFGCTVKRDNGEYDPLNSWFSSPPFALTLYEQAGTRNMQMLYQRNLGLARSGLNVKKFEVSEPGYDERLSRISTSTRLSAARSNFSR